MSNAAITIQNELTTRQSIDVKIDDRRQIRASLAPKGTTGSSIDVGDVADLSELNRAADFRKLLDASPARVSVSITPGTNDILGSDVGAVIDSKGMSSASPELTAVILASTSGARDVVIYTSAFPFAAKLLDAQLMVSTAVSGTLTVRDAAAGAGNALSQALSTTSAGRVRDNGTGQTAGSGVMPTIAKGSSLVLRMTAGDAAGTLNLRFARLS